MRVLSCAARHQLTVAVYNRAELQHNQVSAPADPLLLGAQVLLHGAEGAKRCAHLHGFGLALFCGCAACKAASEPCTPALKSRHLLQVEGIPISSDGVVSLQWLAEGKDGTYRPTAGIYQEKVTAPTSGRCPCALYGTHIDSRSFEMISRRTCDARREQMYANAAGGCPHPGADAAGRHPGPQGGRPQAAHPARAHSGHRACRLRSHPSLQSVIAAASSSGSI